MFQFGRIDTCLFTCKLPLVRSGARLLLTNRYYPLCRRKHTFFVTRSILCILSLRIAYLLLVAALDYALMNRIFPCLYLRASVTLSRRERSPRVHVSLGNARFEIFPRYWLRSIRETGSIHGNDFLSDNRDVYGRRKNSNR